MTNNDDKYTDPELRTEIKEKVQAGDKGGHPGQWSARKAQMMASEYKKVMEERGEEPYTTDKSEQSESQKHLSEWTNEDWQTSEGKAEAKQKDGTEQRYLPKKAWDSMTEEEKQETNEKKLEGSRAGKQNVPNTDAARNARKGSNGAADSFEVDGEDAQHAEHALTDDATKAGEKRVRSEEEDEKVNEGSETQGTQNGDKDEASEDAPAAKKSKTNGGEARATRSRANDESQNENGEGENGENEEDGDEDAGSQKNEHGQQGSAARLPSEDQTVHWKYGRGWAEGAVVEIVRSEQDIGGKHVKASEDDPRVVLKSTKSGKTAVHKPDALYF